MAAQTLSAAHTNAVHSYAQRVNGPESRRCTVGTTFDRVQAMFRNQQGEPLPDEFIELIARRFTALAEPMRIRLLDALHVTDGASVSELAEALGATHANVSKHLNVLHSERIIGRRKEGPKFVYSIADETVLQICDLVCGGVRQRLQELGQLLDPPPRP